MKWRYGGKFSRSSLHLASSCCVYIILVEVNGNWNENLKIALHTGRVCKFRDYQPVCRSISETVRDITIVSMTDYSKIVRALSSRLLHWTGLVRSKWCHDCHLEARWKYARWQRCIEQSRDERRQAAAALFKQPSRNWIQPWLFVWHIVMKVYLVGFWR